MNGQTNESPLCSTGLHTLWGRCPASCHSNSQSYKAGQRVSLTTYGPWATCLVCVSVGAVWGVDGGWMPLLTCTQRYCDPRHFFLFAFLLILISFISFHSFIHTFIHSFIHFLQIPGTYWLMCIARQSTGFHSFIFSFILLFIHPLSFTGTCRCMSIAR